MDADHGRDDSGITNKLSPSSDQQMDSEKLQQGTDVRTTTPAEGGSTVDASAACSSPSGVKDGWAHNQQPPMVGPCKVEYCPTCGMPFEYCEFSGEACSKQKEKEQTDAGMQQQQHEQQLSDELQEKAAITEAKRGAGKKDGSKPKLVTVQKQAKRRGKCATNIWGLEHFGVKQEMVAKLASKHFACGSSFQKGQPGQAPFVEIQGDVEETVAAFLLKNFEIPEDKIVFLAEK